MCQRLSAELIENARQHVGDFCTTVLVNDYHYDESARTFRLSAACDRKRVRRYTRLHFGRVEMDDTAVVLDHVDLQNESIDTRIKYRQTRLLDARDVRRLQFLEIRLQFLLISRRRLVHDLLLSTRSALSIFLSINIANNPKHTFPPVLTCSCMSFSFLRRSSFMMTVLL